MPSQHDLHKHQIAIKFPHRVWRQVEIAAEGWQMSPSEYIRYNVTRDVDSIPLTAKDARIIAERIAKAEEKGKMV